MLRFSRASGAGLYGLWVRTSMVSRISRSGSRLGRVREAYPKCAVRCEEPALEAVRLNLSLGARLALSVGGRLNLALNARLSGLSLGGLSLAADRGADGAGGGGASNGSFVNPSKLSILGLEIPRGATCRQLTLRTRPRGASDDGGS